MFSYNGTDYDTSHKFQRNFLKVSLMKLCLSDRATIMTFPTVTIHVLSKFKATEAKTEKTFTKCFIAFTFKGAAVA